MPKSGEPHHPHDRSHRQLFAHARMVEDLLRGFIPEPWIEELDFSTLKPWPTDFITEDQEEERESDIIWEICWGQRKLLIFILIEFQSSTSRYMPVRMMVYVGLFYQKLLRSKEWQGDKLPPVLPIVLYNGDREWSAPTELSELIDVPEDSDLAAYCPRLRYVLLDEQRLNLGPLSGLENVVAAIFELAQGPALAHGWEIVETVARWLREPKYEALRRDLARWLRLKYLPSQGMRASEMPQVEDLREFVETLETKMQTWSEQLKMEGYQEGVQKGLQKGVQRGRREGLQRGVQRGRQEGIEEGVQRGRREGLRAGEAKVLMRQLESKYGPLDAATRSLVDSASDEQLLLWAERLLSAPTLADVFQR